MPVSDFSGRKRGERKTSTHDRGVTGEERPASFDEEVRFNKKNAAADEAFQKALEAAGVPRGASVKAGTDAPRTVLLPATERATSSPLGWF